MSSPPWQDRRGMFQKGKQVHEPARRPSTGSTGIVEAVRKASVSSIEAIEKTVTGGSVGSVAPPAPTQRRRSSAASTGLFGSLNTAKRGSEGYSERRASHVEQGGVTSGWFNSTFRGVKPAAKGTEK